MVVLKGGWGSSERGTPATGGASASRGRRGFREALLRLQEGTPPPCTLNPDPYTLNPAPSTLNLYNLNPEPWTLNPEP